MSTYLVDFENVGVGGMDGVEKLSDHDRVVIFYGKQAAAVPFERHIEIASSRAEVRYIKVDKTGKNFLDFQLSSYCGYLIGSTAEKDFIIISRDNGFGSMEDFWDGKEMSGKLISMKRRPAIAASEGKDESVREIIVDKGERAGESCKKQGAGDKSGEAVKKKENKNNRPETKERQEETEERGETARKHRRRKRHSDTRVPESGEKNLEETKKLQMEKETERRGEEKPEREERKSDRISAEDRKREEEQVRSEQLKETDNREQTEEKTVVRDDNRKRDEGVERHYYKKRRRPRGQYVWRRQG